MTKAIHKVGRGGRPRIVSREQIIDAGVAIGVENLTMKKVADTLNVSVAALYQYISNRDELRMAVIGRLLDGHTLPADTDQHWTLFIRDYVRMVRKSLAEFPGTIVRRLEDRLSPDWQPLVLRRFQEILVKRGFTTDEAIALAYLSSAAANGAAALRVGLTKPPMLHRDASAPTATDNKIEIFSDVVAEATRWIDQQTEDLSWQLLRPCLERFAAARGESPDVVATWWHS